ncbi:MAG: VWA domain-containing protein [Candidatus Marinimicrobia bacterium]|nr:VWA domain-containing protein [Candidatus Neomarinimicrobiota bacterium]MCF7850691.1 VWA domain-containing protein [Candidatus Neomarinimicrobiota bacterium]
MGFLHSGILWLLLLVPIIVAYYAFWSRKRFGTLRFSSFHLLEGVTLGSGLWRKHILFAMRILAIIALIVALARPQERSALQEMNAEGIDIMLVIDISGSMRATDFKPNRLEAVKKVAQSFVDQRKNDRIGLNVFARESFLQCPLTTDHQRVKEYIGSITIVDERYDGTAVGMALAGGINRLRDSDAKSKVIVLLSDGSNNAGELDPITTSELAKDFGIRIYTIGAGTHGTASLPVQTAIGVRNVQVKVDVDEETLGKIANITGGTYFRATDETSLAEVYQEISEMETTQYSVREYVQHAELFYIPLLIALTLLVLEYILERSIFRRFP